MAFEKFFGRQIFGVRCLHEGRGLDLTERRDQGLALKLSLPCGPFLSLENCLNATTNGAPVKQNPCSAKLL